MAQAVKPAEPRFFSAFLLTEPPNLCLFLGLVGFPGLSDDLDDMIGKAIEKAPRRMVGNVAAVHSPECACAAVRRPGQRCGADTRVCPHGPRPAAHRNVWKPTPPAPASPHLGVGFRCCRVETRLDAFRTRSETPRRQTAVAEKIPRGHPIPDEDGGHPVPIEHPQPDLQALAETEQSAPSPRRNVLGSGDRVGSSQCGADWSQSLPAQIASQA